MADTGHGATMEAASVPCAVCALLAGGTAVRLRPARPEDRAQALRCYDEPAADNHLVHRVLVEIAARKDPR